VLSAEEHLVPRGELELHVPPPVVYVERRLSSALILPRGLGPGRDLGPAGPGNGHSVDLYPLRGPAGPRAQLGPTAGESQLVGSEPTVMSCDGVELESSIILRLQVPSRRVQV
jgi:hypothetical protein